MRVIIEIPETPQFNRSVWNRINQVLFDCMEQLEKTTPEDCDPKMKLEAWVNTKDMDKS